MVSGDLIISQSEHKSRIKRIREQLKKSRCAALYLTNPTRILYSTGFSHISTERPLALVIPQDGTIFMMGPHLEEDHVEQDSTLIEEFFSYPDYPGTTHPILLTEQPEGGATAVLHCETYCSNPGWLMEEIWWTALDG